jgi:hypothetical protein
MTLMTMVRATFWKASSNFGLALLPVRQERTKPAAWARSPLQSCQIAAVAEIVAQGRSKEINPAIFKRAGVSRNPRRSSLRRRQCQFVSPFGSTAIIASCPLLASLQGKSGANGAHKKTIRIIYLNPSASRPLPSKTDRDTNLEGFFWRCL